MGGRQSSGRATLLQAAIVLALITVGLLLFWLHASARKAALIEQNFRLLGDMTEHIRDSVAALDTSLKNAAAAPAPEAASRDQLGGNPQTLKRKPAQKSPTNAAPSIRWSGLLSNLIAQIEPPPTLIIAPTNTQAGIYACSGIVVERTPKSYQLNMSYARSTDQTTGD